MRAIKNFLIFLQTKEEEKFGGYFTHSLTLTEDFYGTGESFLFKC